MRYRFPCFILAIAISQLCAADEANSKEEENSLFQMLDTNRDGYVSRFEAQQDKDLAFKFAALDKNHDNKISREEFTPFAFVQLPPEEAPTPHTTNTPRQAPAHRRGLPGTL